MPRKSVKDASRSPEALPRDGGQTKETDLP